MAQKKESTGSEDGEFGVERERSDGRERVCEEGRLSVVVGERYEAEATNARSGSRFYES